MTAGTSIVQATARPRRGSPDETRRRLVLAAADAFNQDGYEATDTNRIALRAGYAAGTFYKHFNDKKQVFLAVYEDWVTEEWRELKAVADGPAEGARAKRIVELIISHHRRWKGFRASLRVLVLRDAEIRAFHRSQRRRQLTTLMALRGKHGTPASREEAALLMFTLERAADAIADGEAEGLRLRGRAFGDLLVQLVRGGSKP